MKTELKNLPAEFLAAKRFIPVFVNAQGKKVPGFEGWQKPENQMPAEDAARKSALVGFVTCGKFLDEQFLFLDFDHVLDSEGAFVNSEAERCFNDVMSCLEGCYVERSISGDGLHIFALPTPGKFPAVSNSAGKGILYFDKANNIKLEIFFATEARFCLMTGSLFECEKGAGVPSGADVDEIFQDLLKQIERQAEDDPQRVADLKSANVCAFEGGTNQSAEEREYDIFRAKVMLKLLSKVNHKDLSYNRWLAAQTACLNVGVPYEFVDAFNKCDPTNYNAEENRKRWQGLHHSGMTIATLHGIAKKFTRYSERDTRREWYRLHPELSKPRETKNANVCAFERSVNPTEKNANAAGVEERKNIFAELYQSCRGKFPLKDFVEAQGGKWLGLTFETLAAKNCVYHPAFEFESGRRSPCVLIPTNVSLKDAESFYWCRVGEIPDGELREGVARGTQRQPYIASPISTELINFIVADVLDALSLYQVWNGTGYDTGVVATGGAQNFRALVAKIERDFKDSKHKPDFIVLFANDAQGAKYGETLMSALRAAGCPTERCDLAFFGEGVKMPAMPENPCPARGFESYFALRALFNHTEYQPKFSANDCLHQGGDKLLLQRLIENISLAGVFLDMQRRQMK